MDDVPEIPCSERSAKAQELLTILGTTPMYVFDMMLYAIMDEFHFDPTLGEQFLEWRGHHVGENESLYDAFSRIYGERAAKLARELI